MSELLMRSALRLIERGFRIVLLEYGTKRAIQENWTTLPGLTASEAQQLLTQPYNIGVNWSDGSYADIDLDCAEAYALAPYYLPATEMMWGHGAAKRSHYIYKLSRPLDSAAFADPTPPLDVNGVPVKAMICEIRSSGAQTMAPGSIHPNGETIEWHSDGEPAEIDPADLLAWTGLLAASALVAKRWTPSQRHYLSLYLSGALLKSGWSQEQVVYFFRALLDSGAVYDEDRADRIRAIKDSIERIEGDEAVGGWSKVSELLGEQTTDAVRHWLNLDPEREKYHTTDEGNALRFVERFGNIIRYCPEMQKWLIWNTKHWLIDIDDTEVGRLARETVRFIYLEAQSEDDLEYRAVLGKWAAASENGNRIFMIPRLAKHDSRLIVHANELDADQLLLNVQNGTIDLRTGLLQPHRQTDYITKIAKVAYDPTATSLTWTSFIQLIMQNEQDMMEYLQRVAGYCLTGLTTEDCFFVPWGQTRTGKSTFIYAISEVMGDYAQATRAEVFMQRNGDIIPNEIAALQGVRLSTSVETERGQQMALSFMKRITGGDKIRARFMYREFFEYKPTFHIMIATNNRPVIPGDDDAVWERLKLIPFTRYLREEERIEGFRDRLPIEAGEAILTWMVKGCLLWQASRLQEPARVSAAVEAYKSDMDDIGHFIDELCSIERVDAETPSAYLYETYTAWAKSRNTDKLPLPQFKDAIMRRGFTQKRTSKGMMWKGIKVNLTMNQLTVDMLN